MVVSYAKLWLKGGGIVTGIDLNNPALSVAKTHAEENSLPIDYKNNSAENFAGVRPEGFDIVACMELLEHVPDPFSIMLAAKKIVKPGGHVFFSTINRTFRSYLLAIVMSEYVLKLLERNTHDAKKVHQAGTAKGMGGKCRPHVYGSIRYLLLPLYSHMPAVPKHRCQLFDAF